MNETQTPDPQNRLRGAMMLILLGMLAAALLFTVERFTATRIANNIAAARLKSLRAVLPADSYDNQPHVDFIMAQSPKLLGSSEPLPVYRARQGGQPVAAVLTAVAPNGFSGHITLLVAIDIQGMLTGVRVIEHRETPGLGDRIDTAKSDWILGFGGPGNTDTTTEDWALKRDGGTIDQITGATITSRAVLNAVRNAVLYFGAHREELFQPVSDEPTTIKKSDNEQP